MERYRAIVVGCGRIGSGFTADARTPGVHSHAQAYRENPRTELCGLSDVQEERLSVAGRKWGAAIDRDTVALCRRVKPQIVSLCTPNGTHFSLARDLLNATPLRLLFIEKPICMKVV